jgi:hypothetical protein
MTKALKSDDRKITGCRHWTDTTGSQPTAPSKCTCSELLLFRWVMTKEKAERQLVHTRSAPCGLLGKHNERKQILSYNEISAF